VLVVEAILVRIPASAFQVHASDVAALVKLLLNESWVSFFGNHCVHDGLIKGPSFSTTGSLDKGSEVRLRSVEATKPHYLRFSFFIPLFVLGVPAVEMLHPRDEVL